jgi:ectoine hydroxylase-related dioxygenase (phytanoyl-CoA dioxygenase family)
MYLVVKHKDELANKGYTVIDNVFSAEETAEILEAITAADTSKDTFRKTNDLFAVRQFFKEFPQLTKVVFNANLKKVIDEVAGPGYFVVKSIYFDKPPTSNWYVAYHQDLTISVKDKADTEGYGPWTKKQAQFAVQPPVELLENIFTLRIHLDDTNEDNGALKVVPGSHKKKIYRPESIDWNNETEEICVVEKGGIMIMSPLLLHSSGRTVNNKRRRVIHIEFASQQLPETLDWAEKMNC